MLAASIFDKPMDEVIENLSTAIILLDRDLEIIFSNQAETLLMESAAKMRRINSENN